MIPAFKDKRIGVICGGFSVEREVSLRSGKNIEEALQRLGYSTVQRDPATHSLIDGSFDIAFNVLHGQYGEDGGVQSLFEFYNIPYTGSGVTASLLGMNKLSSKQIFQKEGIPTPRFECIGQGQAVETQLSFPVIVKPIDQGSSVGLKLIHDAAAFKHEVPLLLDQFRYCMVEDYVKGQEITVGVIEKNGNLMALPILELRPKNTLYDYEAKYTPGLTDFILPAELSAALTKQCQDLAILIHQKMGCRGCSRIDMIVTHEGTPLVLEINTLPGMTDTSDLPAQAQAAGIGFDQLVDLILHSALVKK